MSIIDLLDIKIYWSENNLFGGLQLNVPFLLQKVIAVLSIYMYLTELDTT